MPENVQAWWERRQRSKGSAVPYAVGTYRAAWASYPMLVRQFRPEYNEGRTLSQIPPAADVYLVWLCDAGHRFVATPVEQRSRPGGRRRRSVWCPVCSELAAPRRPPVAPAPPSGPDKDSPAPPPSSRAVPDTTSTSSPSSLTVADTTLASSTAAPSQAAMARRAASPRGASGRAGKRERPRGAGVGVAGRRAGEAFFSPEAPAPASAVEAELRQRLAGRLELDIARESAGFVNAVAVGRPFHGRLEVWPDIVLTELRVVLEYDTVGRFGLEHVGPREESDRRKDQLLRAAGWEVVRIRCRPLLPIGPHDLEASGVNARLVERIIDRLRDLRGPLMVDAYLTPD
ncbi:hypothetical protein [Herbiconiux liukaitaii]|uniref:hypothetical protein n=1 Tax=Herbiconiux liukaitaii TaxID=3342799 RepID=UPI0035B98705